MPTSLLTQALERHWPRYQPVDLIRGLASAVLDHVLGVPREHSLPGDVLADLVEVYSGLVFDQPFGDHLGLAYMGMASRGGRQLMGQFFTPKVVATAMARINLHGVDLTGDRIVRVIEPSAGSGVMLLAAMEVIAEEHGLDMLQRFSFTAIDLDPLCSLMTAAQLAAAMAGAGRRLAELHVLQGDALGPLSALRTVVHATLPLSVPLTAAQPELAEAAQ